MSICRNMSDTEAVYHFSSHHFHGLLMGTDFFCSDPGPSPSSETFCHIWSCSHPDPCKCIFESTLCNMWQSTWTSNPINLMLFMHHLQPILFIPSPTNLVSSLYIDSIIYRFSVLEKYEEMHSSIGLLVFTTIRSIQVKSCLMIPMQSSHGVYVQSCLESISPLAAKCEVKMEDLGAVGINLGSRINIRIIVLILWLYPNSKWEFPEWKSESGH